MEWSGVGSRSRELRLRLGVPHAARVRLVTYAPKATLWMEHGDRDPTPQHTDRNSRQFLNGRHSKVFFSRCCKIAKPTQHRLGRFLKLWLCDGSKASQGQNYLGWTRPHHLPRSWCLRLDQSSQEGTRRLQAPCQPAFGHHCSPSRRPVIPWRIWQTVHSSSFNITLVSGSLVMKLVSTSDSRLWLCRADCATPSKSRALSACWRPRARW